MKREFKFRAWESEDKEMFTFEDLVNENVSIQYFKDVPQNTVFMQYTGLKDKNNVEIYEGDILVFDYDEDICPFYGKVDYSDDGSIFDGGYFLSDKDGFATDYAFEDDGKPSEWKYLTVIGNIYENPELLK